MAKSKKTLEITQTKTKANRQEIQINDMDYTTSAEPKAFADGRPVFCAHDKIVPIKELRENPLNPNKHPDDQIRALAAIIKATGWRQPITVSTRSGLIVKGHGRLAAAKYGKFKEAPVDYQNYASEEEELADLMADNRIAELAEIDSVKLAEAFEAVDTGAIRLRGVILSGTCDSSMRSGSRQGGGRRRHRTPTTGGTSQQAGGRVDPRPP